MKEYKITSRILLLFVGFVIVPFIMLTIFVMVFVRNYSLSNIGEVTVDAMNSVGTQVSSAIWKTQDESMFVYYTGCVELLSGKELTEPEKERITNAVTAQINSVPEIESIYLVTDRYGEFGGEVHQNVAKLLEPYVEEIKTAGGRCLWYGTNELYGKASEYKYILARSLNSKEGESVGILYLVVNGRMIENIFAQITNTYSVRYLTDEDGRILYSSKPQETGNILDLSMVDPGQRNSYQMIRGSRGEEQILVSHRIMSNGWYCISTIEGKDALHDMQKLILIFGAICAVYVLFLLLMIQMLRKHIFQPLLALKKSMDMYATEGLRPAAIDTGGSGEFRSLSRHFNNMTVRIDRLMQEYKEEAEEKNRQEMKLLTAQLTPHFIYNALNTIKWMAVLNHQEKIQSLVESLIYIFMSVTRVDDENYTVQDELTLVENYAVIQKARFMNFDLVIDAKKDCLDLRIKKLLLQPIVENSIVHGLCRGKMQKSQIIVKVWRDEKLHITVCDEGVGFDVKKWREHPQKEENHTNIGIVNVEKIIQMEYGKDYGLEIKSEPGKGTVVTYLLPILEKRRPET